MDTLLELWMSSDVYYYLDLFFFQGRSSTTDWTAAAVDKKTRSYEEEQFSFLGRR